MREVPIAVFAVALGIGLLAGSDSRAQAVGAGGIGDAAIVKAEKTADDTLRWTIGGGVALVPDYEGSSDYRGALFPLLRAQKGPIYGQIGPSRFGIGLETNLLPSENWRLGPIAALQPGQRDVKDKRVDNVRSGGTTAFGLGAAGGYDFRFAGDQIVGLTLFSLFDVSSVHDGFQIVPEVAYQRPLDRRWSVRLTASGAFASGGYMSEYFGIDNRDAQRSGLDEFDADAAFKDAQLGVTFGYGITDAWRLRFGASYRRLLGDAADSPVVDDRGSANQLVGFLGTSYTW